MVKRFLTGAMTRFAIVAMLCSLSWSAYAIADNTAGHPINIPPQNLAGALQELSRQSGVDLVYRPEQVKGFRTRRLVGMFSAEQAVTKLIQGTSLTVSTDATGALLIAAPIPPAAPARGGTEAVRQSPPSASATRNSLHLGQATSGSDQSAVPVDNSKARDKRTTPQLQEVVVTGTHISGVMPASRVIALDKRYIQTSGVTNIGDLLRSVPQNYGGGSNPALVTNNAPNQIQNPSGGSAPNLLGLGPASTLTLLDGHRLPEANGGAVDITPIPLEAIDRVEIVPDGNSAIYGSDAVAGVVNIILKKDFDGAQTTALLGGTSDGGGFENTVGQLLGRTWGNGGAMFDYHYEHQDAVMSGQRDYTESARRPATILPSINQNSVFASAHQDLGNSASIFGEGYYATRHLIVYITSPTGSYTGTIHDEASEYYATAGVNFELPLSWGGSVFASSSRDSTDQRSTIKFLTPPREMSNGTPYRGTSQTFEASADGRLLSLPWGDVLAALGAGSRRERFAAFGTTQASRTVEYAYGEFHVPLIKASDRPGLNKLNLSLSGRYERYSDFGISVVPKVGLLWGVTPEINLHVTWGKSFQAPLLDDTGSPEDVVLNTLPDPLSPTRTSDSLIRLLGNPDLRPQTARNLSAGADYRPRWLENLHLFADYFAIRYTNVITNLASYGLALENPADAPLVTRNPSASLQQQILSGAAMFINFTGTPYDPALVASTIDGRPLNSTFEKAEGANLGANYSASLGRNNLNASVNGTYLDLSERFTSVSPPQRLSGVVFEPPRFRGRATATWSVASWSFTGTANYTGAEKNIYLPGSPKVDSWTTMDLQIALNDETQTWGPFQIAFSVQNVFDANPPFVRYPSGYPGQDYDPTNASPLGRFMSLRVSKTF